MQIIDSLYDIIFKFYWSNKSLFCSARLFPFVSSITTIRMLLELCTFCAAILQSSVLLWLACYSLSYILFKKHTWAYIHSESMIYYFICWAFLCTLHMNSLFNCFLRTASTIISALPCSLYVYQSWFCFRFIMTWYSFLQWTFHPFVYHSKRFYTVLLWRRVFAFLVVSS